MPFPVLLPAIQQEVDDNKRLRAKNPEKTENMFIMSIIKQQNFFQTFLSKPGSLISNPR